MDGVPKLGTSASKIKQLGINSAWFSVVLALMISISLTQTSYAQTQPNLEEQTTLSKNLLNDPIAQDLLKKIEQTKKMIEELKQKEYEKNQAQENLEKMREMSIKQLSQDLDEWERQSEKYSSRNAFNNFVNKVPDYVQGVFWDQFEFMEQKANAGRIAMNQVLASGGTMQDAKQAYNTAAATQKIELIEMNSQFNVKHNLANYAEQQLFNSTGQIHFSEKIQDKITQLYSDYKLQPSYILANMDDGYISSTNDVQCGEGKVSVSRLTTGSKTCVDELTAKKWIDNGITGIIIDGNSRTLDVKTNPGTKCNVGYNVIYNLKSLEYQCVLESTAKEMLDANMAEIHTLSEYVLNKDNQKTTDDKIYQINKEIHEINSKYDYDTDMLDTKYNSLLDAEKSNTKQRMQEIINEYRINSEITKEEITRIISEIRKASDITQDNILREKQNALHELEKELKKSLSKIVIGYENNPSINVDWGYLYKSEITKNPNPSTNSNNVVEYSEDQIKTSLNDNVSNGLQVENINIVNSFGMEFDQIKSGQVLQIAADITNYDESEQNFTYIVEIMDNTDKVIQPAKWMTGTLNPEQTLNVGLSWIPEEAGKFKAVISTGTEMKTAKQVTEIPISVDSQGSIPDVDFCKDGHELLFKYSDNSPICATHNTAFKLINIGLAFS